MSGPQPNIASPYVDCRPFERDDAQYFFGRETELGVLSDLVIAERIVVVYAASGVGKTSLVQGGLVERLKQTPLVALPTIRVGSEDSESGNRFVGSVLRHLGIADGTPMEKIRSEIKDATTKEAARRSPDAKAASGTTAESVAQESPSLQPKHAVPLLVFDQFEEVFLRDPADVPAKREFFDWIGELLEDRGIWAVFVIREDYIGVLDAFAEYVPTSFAHRYRLNFLHRDQAKLAIKRPALKHGVNVLDEAADKILDESGGTIIEPMFLEMICASVWAGWAEKEEREPRIVALDVQSYGNLDEVLCRFIDGRVADTVEALAPRALHDQDARFGLERRIRLWLEQSVVSGRDRVPVRQGAKGTAGLDNDVVRELDERKVVRIFFKRADETWYELAHDRLIPAVRASNGIWRNGLTGLRKATQDWIDGNRAGKLLASGWQLWTLKRSAKEIDIESPENALEKEFLLTSDSKAKERRLFHVGVGVATVLVTVAMIAAALRVGQESNLLDRIESVDAEREQIVRKMRSDLREATASPAQSYRELAVAIRRLDPDAVDRPMPGTTNPAPTLEKSPLQRAYDTIAGKASEDLKSANRDKRQRDRRELLHSAARVSSEAPLLGSLQTKAVIAVSDNGTALVSAADGSYLRADLAPFLGYRKPTVTTISGVERDGAYERVSGTGKTVLLSRATGPNRDGCVKNLLQWTGARAVDVWSAPRATPNAPERCLSSITVSASGLTAIMVATPVNVLAPPKGSTKYELLMWERDDEAGNWRVIGTETIEAATLTVATVPRADKFLVTAKELCKEQLRNWPNCDQRERTEFRWLERVDGDRRTSPKQLRSRVVGNFPGVIGALPLSNSGVAILTADSVSGSTRRDPTCLTEAYQEYRLAIFIQQGSRLRSRGKTALICSIGRAPFEIPPSIMSANREGTLVGLLQGDRRDGRRSVCVYETKSYSKLFCDPTAEQLHFARDGCYLFTATKTGLIRVWHCSGDTHAEDARPLAVFHHQFTGETPGLMTIADDRALVSYEATAIQVWDLRGLSSISKGTDTAKSGTSVFAGVKPTLQSFLRTRFGGYPIANGYYMRRWEPQQGILRFQDIQSADAPVCKFAVAHETVKRRRPRDRLINVEEVGGKAFIAVWGAGLDSSGEVVQYCDVSSGQVTRSCIQWNASARTHRIIDDCGSPSARSVDRLNQPQTSHNLVLSRRGDRLVICTERTCTVLSTPLAKQKREPISFSLPEDASMGSISTLGDEWLAFSPNDGFVTVWFGSGKGLALQSVRTDTARPVVVPLPVFRFMFASNRALDDELLVHTAKGIEVMDLSGESTQKRILRVGSAVSRLTLDAAPRSRCLLIESADEPTVAELWDRSSENLLLKKIAHQSPIKEARFSEGDGGYGIITKDERDVEYRSDATLCRSANLDKDLAAWVERAGTSYCIKNSQIQEAPC